MCLEQELQKNVEEDPKLVYHPEKEIKLLQNRLIKL